MSDDASNDPFDPSRTTRKQEGETVRSGSNAPGLVLVAIAVVGSVIALAVFAGGHSAAGLAATAVSAMALFAGGGWLFVAHRHVREREARRPSDPDAQPPAR